MRPPFSSHARLAAAATFVLLLLLNRAREATSLSNLPTTPPSPFQRFVVAPNGVCTRPEIFYMDDNDDERGGTSRGVAGGGSGGETAREGDDGREASTFSMRNVPGEGDCMFLAVALATAASMGLGGNDALLRAISSETRNVVAQILGGGGGNLVVEGRRLVSAADLLRSAARGEGLTTEVYLDRLRRSGSEGGLYGGGPELTVLTNVLRRPISIYELDDALDGDGDGDGEGRGDSAAPPPRRCRIKRVGVFGYPRFKDPCLGVPDSAVLSGLQPGAYSWHLHVLVVDASPGGEKHACVLMPKFCDLP